MCVCYCQVLSVLAVWRVSQRTEAAEKVPFCAVCLIIIIHRGLMVLDWGKGREGPVTLVPRPASWPGGKGDHEVGPHPPARLRTLAREPVRVWGAGWG